MKIRGQQQQRRVWARAAGSIRGKPIRGSSSAPPARAFFVSLPQMRGGGKSQVLCGVRLASTSRWTSDAYSAFIENDDTLML